MRLGPDEITVRPISMQICERCELFFATHSVRVEIGGRIVIEGRYCEDDAKKRRAELLAAEDN